MPKEPSVEWAVVPVQAGAALIPAVEILGKALDDEPPPSIFL